MLTSRWMHRLELAGTHSLQGFGTLLKIHTLQASYEVQAAVLPTYAAQTATLKRTSDMQALHAAGFVHRDLKPENLIRMPNDHMWYLIDFGCTAVAGAPADLLAGAPVSRVMPWQFLQNSNSHRMYHMASNPRAAELCRQLAHATMCAVPQP